MKTPREKYMNDNHYHALVNLMLAQIEQCKFTPSELREASVLASILYAENHIRPFLIDSDDKIEKALNTMNNWICEKEKED